MTTAGTKVAFFWDKSFLWGLIAYDTFRELGVSFDLVTAADIRDGQLSDYALLFVPGGWASDKIVALGDEGRERIREFVASGGSYFGVCGGAGLALSHENGLSLTRTGRIPSSVRLPSLSGSITLAPSAPDHPMWRGCAGYNEFHVWWPGQFALDEAGEAEVLARYGDPGVGSYVTDLPVLPSMNWALWEERYGINLDPERIRDEPAVIETIFGEGKVFLSYPHFETPGDTTGHRVLLNILEYLGGGQPVAVCNTPTSRASDAAAASCAADADASSHTAATAIETSGVANELLDAAGALIDFGKKNYLWYQRNDWILQWRRGVRGVEYSTLYAMLKKLAALMKTRSASGSMMIAEETPGRDLLVKIQRLQSLTLPFFAESRKLLTLERDAISRGPLSSLKTDNKQILDLREKLFSNSKRCGGLYEEIINLADEILLPLLRENLGQLKNI